MLMSSRDQADPGPGWRGSPASWTLPMGLVPGLGSGGPLAGAGAGAGAGKEALRTAGWQDPDSGTSRSSPRNSREASLKIPEGLGNPRPFSVPLYSL